MGTGPKILLGSVGVLLLVTGVELAVIHHRNQESMKEPVSAEAQQTVTDDDLVVRRQMHAAYVKDEKALIGKTIWMAAGGQINYYKDSGNHADYMKPVGVLEGAEALAVNGVFEQVAPKAAMLRIPPGKRQVLLAFTLPQSTDPKAEYAVPVGYLDDTGYTFFDDEIFFYDDPRELYKHWGPEVWAHIDKHEAALGMTEAQAMIALGQVMEPHGETAGDRSITFHRPDKDVTVEFEKGKAVRIS